VAVPRIGSAWRPYLPPDIGSNPRYCPRYDDWPMAMLFAATYPDRTAALARIDAASIRMLRKGRPRFPAPKPEPRFDRISRRAYLLV